MPENIITKPATMEVIDRRHCYLTIKEGKYHQVKRMFEKVGNKVMDLERVSFGNLKLPRDLEYGEYIEIKREDIIG